MTRVTGNSYLCYFRARRYAQTRAADQVGRRITAGFSGGYISAGDLSSALAQVFAATVRVKSKPKTAAILAYLGQNLAQTILGRRRVRLCFRHKRIARSHSLRFPPDTPPSASQTQPPADSNHPATASAANESHVTELSTSANKPTEPGNQSQSRQNNARNKPPLLAPRRLSQPPLLSRARYPTIRFLCGRSHQLQASTTVRH
jgi:hypothetical protein